MGILQFVLASFLKAVLFPAMYAINCVFALYSGSFMEYNHRLALVQDIYGNHFMKHVLNLAFLKKESTYKYGLTLETISHVTAVNYRCNQLTNFGKLFAKTLIICGDKAFK